MLIEITDAVARLKNNEIVALPTETVYGLAGNANNENACAKIYIAKGRPSFNPLIVHVRNLEEAKSYGEFSHVAENLARAFWPGPISLVVKKQKTCLLAGNVTADMDTLALRVPAHPIFQKILASIDFPLAAPSANKSEHISPTSCLHVIKSFHGNIPVVDGGNTTYGIESTIIDCTGDLPVILRHGFITKENIESLLGHEILLHSGNKVIAPGMALRHYSPNCKLRINAESANNNELCINFGRSNLEGKFALNLSKDGSLIEAAANFYSFLHQAEDIVLKNNLDGIAVATIPNNNIGIAINDKLIRAKN